MTSRYCFWKFMASKTGQPSFSEEISGQKRVSWWENIDLTLGRFWHGLDTTTRPASRVHLSDVIVQNDHDDRCLRPKQLIKNMLQKPVVTLNFRELSKPDYDLGLPNCDLRTDGLQFLDTYRHFGWIGALYGPSGNLEHPKDSNALFWTLI